MRLTLNTPVTPMHDNKYDDIIKDIPLTCDETEMLKTLLEAAKERCVSLGEEIVIEDLLDKLA